MPKSKRDKKVSLTKVSKKGSAKNTEFIEKLRTHLPQYENVFILSISGMRTGCIKNLRSELPDSKLIFGKNRLISVAFGRTPAESYRPGLYKMCKLLREQKCILLTNKSYDELRETFDSVRDQEYARSGNVAEQTVDLLPGPLPKFPHTMEPVLRGFGLNTRLARGVVTLEKEYRICKKGDVLNPEQCRLLKHFDIQLAEFRVNVVAEFSTASENLIDHSGSDPHLVRTSLPKHVKVSCQTLDDGQYYFVPEPVEQSEQDAEDVEAMEQDDKDLADESDSD